MSKSVPNKQVVHSDVSRNECAKVKLSSKQLREGVNYLVWGFLSIPVIQN